VVLRAFNGPYGSFRKDEAMGVIGFIPDANQAEAVVAWTRILAP
jgi:hypothetical protein